MEVAQSQIIAKTEQSIQESSEEKLSKVNGEMLQSHEGTPSPGVKKHKIKDSAKFSKENSPANKSIRGNDYDYQIKQQ